MYEDIHNRTIYNSPKLEINQIPINSRMRKKKCLLHSYEKTTKT